MAALDVEALTAPLSDEAPCGENLEYDPQYVQLDQAKQITPEQQYGDTVVPAQDPDWKQVQQLALDLLSRTRDLGVAVTLTQAATAVQGLQGFADGLRVIRGYHEQCWEHFHPQLDPDDDNDPTMRANLLANLAQPDPTLRLLRDAPLITSRVGRFSWKHILIARGELPHDGEGDPPSLSLIEGAFGAQDAEDVQALRDTLGEALDALKATESAMTERCGAAAVPNLSRLRDQLTNMHSFVQERLGSAATEAGDEATDGSAPPPGGAPAAVPAGPALSGEIHSRDDVRRAIDKIIRYYEKHEPGHPIPLLLKRVRFLVEKDFLQIMADLAPDTLDALRSLGGSPALDAASEEEQSE